MSRRAIRAVGAPFEGSMTGLTLDGVAVTDNVSQGSGGGIRVGTLVTRVNMNNVRILRNRTGSDLRVLRLAAVSNSRG